jgi:hypothetical protein
LPCNIQKAVTTAPALSTRNLQVKQKAKMSVKLIKHKARESTGMVYIPPSCQNRNLIKCYGTKFFKQEMLQYQKLLVKVVATFCRRHTGRADASKGLLQYRTGWDNRARAPQQTEATFQVTDYRAISNLTGYYSRLGHLVSRLATVGTRIGKHCCTLWRRTSKLSVAHWTTDQANWDMLYNKTNRDMLEDHANWDLLEKPGKLRHDVGPNKLKPSVGPDKLWPTGRPDKRRPAGRPGNQRPGDPGNRDLQETQANEDLLEY